MANLRAGAWINAHTGQWSYIDEHANWAKREGNLQSIGLPASIWETIREIPNDYRGDNRKMILLTVMAAGGIRMRAHGDFVTFEFTVDAMVALPACRGALHQIAGEFTLCRFNNLSTNETVEVFYDNYLKQMENSNALDWQAP